MVSNEQLEKTLADSNEVDYVNVSGDGYHYQVVVVSDAFLNMKKLARQQWVYSLLGEYIASGALHALTMQTFTREEWETRHG